LLYDLAATPGTLLSPRVSAMVSTPLYFQGLYGTQDVKHPEQAAVRPRQSSGPLPS
jgi:hypothetical protein